MTTVRKFLSAILVLLAVASLLCIWLIVHYQPVVPSDVVYSLLGDEWAIDSAFVHTIDSPVGPNDRLMRDDTDTVWSLYGAIYAHNNLRRFLSIDTIKIQEDSAQFSASAEMWYLCPPSREDRRNPHFFMNERFGLVWSLRSWNAHRDEKEFGSIIGRAFKAQSLRVVLRTNRGNIAVVPRGYTSISFWELIHKYPIPPQPRK